MEVVKAFKQFFELDIKWAVCGGDSIDLFIGKQTRNHKDLDVAVFWEDREKIIDYMLKKNWRVFEPDSGKLREITSLTNDLRTEDNLWCLTSDNTSYNIIDLGNSYFDIQSNLTNQESLDFVEFLFNKIDNNVFLYKRNHQINLPLEEAILTNDAQIPFLAPQLVLLYKSIFTRFINSDIHQDMVKNYRHDFNVSLNKLSYEQSIWLLNSLTVSYPNGHEWIDRLTTIKNV